MELRYFLSLFHPLNHLVGERRQRWRKKLKNKRAKTSKSPIRVHTSESRQPLRKTKRVIRSHQLTSERTNGLIGRATAMRSKKCYMMRQPRTTLLNSRNCCNSSNLRPIARTDKSSCNVSGSTVGPFSIFRRFFPKSPHSNFSRFRANFFFLKRARQQRTLRCVPKGSKCVRPWWATRHSTHLRNHRRPQQNLQSARLKT